MLYLPTLNADIIDYGVARGDTDYIPHTGVVMRCGHAGPGVRQVSSPSISGHARPWLPARDIRHRPCAPGERLPSARWESSAHRRLITRTTNDVQQVQMLAVMSVSLVIMAPISASAVSSWASGSPRAWWVLPSPSRSSVCS